MVDDIILIVLPGVEPKLFVWNLLRLYRSKQRVECVLALFRRALERWHDSHTKRHLCRCAIRLFDPRVSIERLLFLQFRLIYKFNRAGALFKGGAGDFESRASRAFCVGLQIHQLKADAAIRYLSFFSLVTNQRVVDSSSVDGALSHISRNQQMEM